MKRKSQTTIFIILGIVIVAALTGYFLFKDKISSSNVGNLPNDMNSFNSFMQDCFDKTLQEGVFFVAEKGGYYDNPTNVNGMGVAYYLMNKNNYMPSKTRVEEEIAKYVNNELVFCLNNFNDFPELQINGGEITSEVKIENDNVKLTTLFPLAVIKDNRTYKLRDFSSQLYKIRLGLVYDVAKKIIDEQSKDMSGICIGCLYNHGKDNDLYINTMNYETGVVFTIIDKNSKINEKELVFNFANKYV